MPSEIKWTNPSVLQFAAGKNPVSVMEERVRSIILRAMDDGWVGPPYDPVALGRLYNFPIEARSDIPDARTISRNDQLVIEYNPLRPQARVRFSVAHEIAHSLFPDCADAIRNRGGSEEPEKDDWQLEMLCNIGAAELIMPTADLPDFDDSNLTIDTLMSLRQKFGVSAEAILLRTAKLSDIPCAAFCASVHNNRYRIDYIVPSRSWVPKTSAGYRLPENTAVAEANAIGYTSIGDELWADDEILHVECIGLSPYPGFLIPRVVGLIRPVSAVEERKPSFVEVAGDALSPRGEGNKIVAQVVPNSSLVWGGGGFANAVKRKYPGAWKDFKNKAELTGMPLTVGTCIKCQIDQETTLLNMVAQYGIGMGPAPRIRYSALEACLKQLADMAKELGASVHMPRIGTGHAGGDWNLIRELIIDIVARQGVEVTVYSLPPRTNGQKSTAGQGIR